MSTLSDHPARLPFDPRPPAIDAQRAEVLGVDPRDTAAASARWELVADLLDDLVTDYDERLESGASDDDRAAAGAVLQEVMNGFDVVGAVARRNAEVLDELATEITLAQARMNALWNEYTADAARADVPRLNERRYTMRAAREVWYPLDGDVRAAAATLRSAPPAASDEADSTVIPLNRR